MINKLAEPGLKKIEATSFVSPKWVPQMKDAFDVMLGIERRPGVTYPVLIPNMKGFERALDANISEIAIFITASEAFSQKNNAPCSPIRTSCIHIYIYIPSTHF